MNYGHSYFLPVTDTAVEFNNLQYPLLLQLTRQSER